MLLPQAVRLAEHLNREAVSALEPASLQYCPPGTRGHAGAESVHALPWNALGLPGSFHFEPLGPQSDRNMINGIQKAQQPSATESFAGSLYEMACACAG